jgi:transposase
MLTIGLDTHLRTSTLCILDDHGRQINTRTVRGHWTRTVDYLRSLDDRFRIVFEASCGYGPLHDAIASLSRAAKVVVAHPGRLRWIFKSKRKNDRVDAQKLAKLLYLDEVPTAHVPSIDGRAWRELIEFRRRSVDKRTQTKNGLRAMLRAHGVAVPRECKNLWTKRGRAWLETVELPTAHAALRRELLLGELDHAESVVAKVTARLDAIADDHPGVQLLRTVPGVGPRTAEAFIAYVDDPHRFARVSRVGAYFGLVPTQDASASVNRLGHITKQGPATVRKLLVEASWMVIRKDDAMRAFFDRVCAGKKERRKIALVAVAHKLTRCMFAMLRSGEVWRPRKEGADAAMTDTPREATVNS